MATDESKIGNGNGAKRAIETFRLITPVLVTVCIFIVSGISIQLAKLDNKVFVHLTNHEIHIPRGQVVGQAEFTMHCQFSEEAKLRFEQTFKDMSAEIREVLTEVREHNNQ